jgi:hypothetical protein
MTTFTEMNKEKTQVYVGGLQKAIRLIIVVVSG